MALLKLTCPLDSDHHLELARSCKQNKVEYQQLSAELDCLDFPNFYETLKVSVLGHYQCFSVKNVLHLLHFIHPDLPLPKVMVQQMLDTACSKELYISFAENIYGPEMQ